MLIEGCLTTRLAFLTEVYGFSWLVSMLKTTKRYQKTSKNQWLTVRTNDNRYFSKELIHIPFSHFSCSYLRGIRNCY